MAQSKNILILDDQDQWRLVLSMLLKKEGYNIFEAENIEDAKQFCSKYLIDLVTIDLRIIDSDSYDVGGLEFLYFIKKIYPKIKTIILTGYPEAIQNHEMLKELNILRKVPENGNFDINGFILMVKKLLDEPNEIKKIKNYNEIKRIKN